MSDEVSAHEMAALFTQLAMLGSLPCGLTRIDAHQIHAWHDHRARNGFPASLPERRHEGRYRPVRVWNVLEAVQWLASYVPGKAGAPKGNSNARTHGMYAGRRAAQAAARAAKSCPCTNT